MSAKQLVFSSDARERIHGYLDELQTKQRYPIYRALQHPLYPILRKIERKHEHLHHVESVRDELSDFLVVPVCHEIHEGSGGIHGLHRRGFERRYKVTEMKMLAKVNELLA